MLIHTRVESQTGVGSDTIKGIYPVGDNSGMDLNLANPLFTAKGPSVYVSHGGQLLLRLAPSYMSVYVSGC